MAKKNDPASICSPACNNAMQYESMIKNIPGAIYRCRVVKDAGFVMDFMSCGVEELSGYPADDFLNNRVRSFNSIILPEDREKVVKALFNGVARREIFTVEYRIKCLDGQIKWISERGKAQYDAKGKLLWIDGACFDITEQKEMEAKLIRSEKLKGVLEMSGAVCHEMNQPMTAAIILLQLLADDISNENDKAPSFQKDIMEILEHLEKMRVITNKLMNINCYKTQEYIKGQTIIDINSSSSECELD
ncbi:hypothetical protein MTBBW1_1630024 [Desulfamplus magnetovallimortis]|uniref:histidine kinase n=1 Tax=Desulfamplus magnetovallimortis TaxID=1246637 RepID=A0A1W1H906_9BACT|nr:PAS domain-containing protein [Desulfamplus magnetovallimortis]SLM28914.1 hypothetical protein MTBBW1_1630024 [Desulfamplus magnetovallimortis]